MFLLRCIGLFATGSVVIVSTIVLSDKALTPFPDRASERELHMRAAQQRYFRDQCEVLQMELRAERDAAREERIARTKAEMNLNTVLRNAVLLPTRPELPVSDMIPAQNLPTIPEARP